ncbi:MAG: B12-binding domain-containing protein [Caldilineales bacterium]|nr:B12-binding domain-containing protein [Caldilineales bacterium]
MRHSELFDAIVRGDESEAVLQSLALAASSADADEIVRETTIPAIREVNHQVDEGRMYIPDLLISVRAFSTSLDALQTKLSESTRQLAASFTKVDVTCFL